MEIQKEMDAAEETISSLTSDKERLSQEVLQAQKEMLALVEQAKVGDSAKSQLTSVEEALKTSNEQLLEATVSLTTHRFTAPNFSILVPVLLLSSPRTRFGTGLFHELLKSYLFSLLKKCCNDKKT